MLTTINDSSNNQARSGAKNKGAHNPPHVAAAANKQLCTAKPSAGCHTNLTNRLRHKDKGVNSLGASAHVSKQAGLLASLSQAALNNKNTLHKTRSKH